MGCPRLPEWSPLRFAPRLPRPRPRIWTPPYCSIGVNANVTRQDIASVTATTTLVKPTGTASTDVLIAVFGDDTSSSPANTVSGPAGWTAVNTAIANTTEIRLSCFWALGSVANLGFTNNHTGASYQQGVVVVGFTGVDNVTPIDATGTTNTSTSAGSITANLVTVATDQAWHLIAVCSWNGGTWTATGFTVRQNAASPPASNADGTLLYNTTPKGVGSTGTVSVASNASTSGQLMCAMPFALRPAASGTFPGDEDEGLRYTPIIGWW